MKRWDYPGIGPLVWTVPLGNGCPSTKRAVLVDGKGKMASEAG